MLAGSAVTAFSPLDWTGITAITGASIVGVGALIKGSMYVCTKCKAQVKEMRDKMKCRLGLCEGCWRCE